MPKIIINNPGLLTTIQDRGRWGFQNVGMSVAGAMDLFALRCANLLIGNDEYEAALEITFMGPEIKFNCSEVISITGADMSPTINEKEVPMWQSIRINDGDILKLSGAKSGIRTYIAFSRGFNVPSIMKSKSTFLRGNLGGFEGRKLNIGDEIELNDKDLGNIGYQLSEEYIPEYSKTADISIVFGPQEDYFSEEARNTFISSEYKITSESDRMGFRLDGPKIEHLNGADIISDGIVFGSIQVPGHGNPIIMMADRQTTGGYTKIATVISSDLSKVAQLIPGSTIRFHEKSIEEAQDIYIKYENTFEEIKESLKKSSFYLSNVESDAYSTTASSNDETISKTKKFRVLIGDEEFEVIVTEDD